MCFQRIISATRLAVKPDNSKHSQNIWNILQINRSYICKKKWSSAALDYLEQYKDKDMKTLKSNTVSSHLHWCAWNWVSLCERDRSTSSEEGMRTNRYCGDGSFFLKLGNGDILCQLVGDSGLLRWTMAPITGAPSTVLEGAESADWNIQRN